MLSFHFIAALWSPAGKGLTSWLPFVIFNCGFVTFPCGTLGKVWYLIVLIPHLCPLSYFYCDWEQQWLCWDCMDTETHLSLCCSLVQQVPKSHVMAHQCRFLMKIFFSSVFWVSIFSVMLWQVFLGWTSTKQGIMSCSRTPENLTPQKCPGTFPNILSTNLLRLLRDAKYLWSEYSYISEFCKCRIPQCKIFTRWRWE